MDINKED